MEQNEFQTQQTPTTWSEASRLGYGAELRLWIDIGNVGGAVAALPALISTEVEHLTDFYTEGPWDSVWEAEFFEALVDLTSDAESLHDVAPGTYSVVVALAMAGARVVTADNDGALDDPPTAGTPHMLFFIASDRLERIRRAAEECGLHVVRKERNLWSLTGTSLRPFPTFAARILATP
jgi:hypothetical protein